MKRAKFFEIGFHFASDTSPATYRETHIILIYRCTNASETSAVCPHPGRYRPAGRSVR